MSRRPFFFFGNPPPGAITSSRRDVLLLVPDPGSSPPIPSLLAAAAAPVPVPFSELRRSKLRHPRPVLPWKRSIFFDGRSNSGLIRWWRCRILRRSHQGPWTPSPAALPRNPSGSASRRPSPRRTKSFLSVSVAARGEGPDKFSEQYARRSSTFPHRRRHRGSLGDRLIPAGLVRRTTIRCQPEQFPVPLAIIKRERGSSPMVRVAVVHPATIVVVRLLLEPL